MTRLLSLPLLAFANAAAIAAFAIDKRRAIAGEWRIAESTLLLFAAAGGTPGALWARARFRHKTRKQPFSDQLELIAMIQAGILLGLATVVLF